ncbi:programmed cell death protein 2-like [Eurosta solidaginis]|uniref:programmed cell death protein 2-like n=1 Tax=Eurosta solidaginis TaxID=178769 RepID=UPI0035311EDF
MAKNKSTVYLGYEDEEITSNHGSILNSTVNKVGGAPDWPSGEIKVPSCPLCGTARPLIVQLYAPLEQSQFHRTLYVFACLNPACSQNSKSWLCIRTQHLDTPSESELINAVPPPLTAGGGGGMGKKKKNAKHATQSQKISWCSGADDWGDALEENCFVADSGVERMDTGADDLQYQNEENGNIIRKNDNSPTYNVHMPRAVDSGNSDGYEDDDDESNSMDNELVYSLSQIDMHSPQNAVEDPNANCAAGNAATGAGVVDGFGGGGGAMVGFGGATATICAEIEGAETDVVLVETPLKPERDLIALLKHTGTPAALGPLAKIADVTIKAFFLAVEKEQRHRLGEYDNYGGALSSDHTRELYQEYKRQDEAAHSPNGAAAFASGGGGAAGNSSGGAAAALGDDQEVYEKTLPAHGDIIFHQFISTIQQNPGQLIRYSRDTLPLLVAPLSEPIPKCANCNGETICEVQILSTLIPKLRLQQNNEPIPIEYGNVLVFTCLKCCWDTPDKMRYERVIVQAEK